MLAELRESIARVLEARCPRQAVHAHIDGKIDLGRAVWDEAASLGWLSIGVSEAQGGLGLGESGLAVLHTELGRVFAPGPFLSTLAAAQWIAYTDPSSTGHDLLQQIIAGQLRVAVPAVLGAVLGAGELVRTDNAIRGELTLIGGAECELALVPDTEDRWMLLPLEGTATVAALDMWDRTRDICVARLESVRPLATWRLARGIGEQRLLRILSLALAHDSNGGAQGIAAQTLDYLKVRRQFGRAVGSFQALKHRIADIYAGNATQECLADHASAAVQAASPHAEMWCWLAKASATDWYAAVAGDCIQLHGGLGHTWEYDVHIAVKRARLSQALAQSNNDLRDRAAAELRHATSLGHSTLDIVA